jgi:ABC-type uncharacterized transport system ATPase subunit
MLKMLTRLASACVYHVGAGKTTLMDVIAGRKTVGRITGVQPGMPAAM